MTKTNLPSTLSRINETLLHFLVMSLGCHYIPLRRRHKQDDIFRPLLSSKLFILKISPDDHATENLFVQPIVGGGGATEVRRHLGNRKLQVGKMPTTHPVISMLTTVN